MNWPSLPLKEVAPARSPESAFAPDERVWHVTLDQIESNTGAVVNKKYAPASEAGTSTNTFDEENVLYSKLRPYLNKVVCPTEPGIATTELIPLRPRKDLISRKFLTYYLRSNHFLGFANVAVAGVKMPRIIMAKFWEHRVPLPPPSEQRRIVEILDQADALRKKRVEADAIAERILPALFYKMFGDPATNPKEWPMVPIRNLVTSIERRNPNDQPESVFRYVDISGVDGQTGLILEAKELLGKEAPSRARQTIRSNDVIVSTVRPYLRATAIVPEHLDNQICSTGYCVLRAREGRGYGFLFALSRLQWFTDQLSSRARGASYPAISDNDILELHVPHPDAGEIHSTFDQQVHDANSILKRGKQLGDELDRLYSVMLHRAFAGELTAQWRDAHKKELLAEMEEQARILRIRAKEVASD